VTPKPLPVEFDALPGFAEDDALAAFAAFRDWARAAAADAPALRAAKAPSPRLTQVARAACGAIITDSSAARRFFVENFRPWRVASDAADGAAFFTGYYEPEIDASLTPTPEFHAPVLARPRDLVAFEPGEGPPGLDPKLAGAERREDGSLAPYPDRAAIEAKGGEAVAWLADEVEVFFAQVQGSARLRLADGRKARLRLADGRKARLVYDGRNGQPYTSIGRLLIEAGEIGESEMSLARLKAWLRANGLKPGDKGRAIMQRNASYVFFRLVEDVDPALGPIGGAGIALTPLRSIAVDRALWSYGLPFWIDAALPWESDELSPFRRLMVDHDTGSAIVGPARADIFFGSGEAAGARAGAIRHRGAFAVLAPLGDEP
jgi:membrane-bound lytic murein transglycosylase A